MKIFAKMDPEDAHRLAINLLLFGLFPHNIFLSKDPIMEQNIFGINFSNPIGLAAGFDKNAEAFKSILSLGCGFVEVGSFTPRPQFGNPKPRAFWLLEDEAAISRHGFNNDGQLNVSNNRIQPINLPSQDTVKSKPIMLTQQVQRLING